MCIWLLLYHKHKSMQFSCQVINTTGTGTRAQMQKSYLLSTPNYYSLRVQSMSLPLPDQQLPPPPVSNAQTTAPFQQMLTAVVGKTNGRNSISLCASAGIAKALQNYKEEVGQNRREDIRTSSFDIEIPSKRSNLISKKN